MNITVQFYRPFDREPDIHFYGEPFDQELDILVGGKDNWSSAKETPHKKPKAELKNFNADVSLHEDGAILNFIANHIDVIPDFITAISSLIGAWAILNQQRLKDNKEGALIHQKRGYLIKVDDAELQLGDSVDEKALKAILAALAEYEKRKDDSA